MPSGSSRLPQAGASTFSPDSRSGILYPLMLDAIDEAICMFDCNGELTWQNKASLSLCNQQQDSGQDGKGLRMQMTEVQMTGFSLELSRAIAGESSLFDWVCQYNNRRYQIQLRPLLDGVKVIAVMGTIREISTIASASSPEQVVNLNRIFERVTDAFFALDKDWNYTYINQKAEELHGRGADELLGKNIWQEFPDVVTEPFYYSLQNAMRTQQPVRVELYYSGQQKWFEDFIYPSPEGVSVYYRDITVYKKMDEQLLRSEQQYRSLVEQAADAIIIADLQGLCLDINSMAEKMTGYTREELNGFNLFDLLVMPPGEPPIRLKEILDNQVVLQERKVRRKDGRTFYAELNTKRLSGDRILIIGRDISDRKSLEKVLQESEFRYRTLFEQGPDGVCFYDTEKNTYLAVNKRMTEMFGYSQEEFRQMEITGIAFPDDILVNPPMFIGLDTDRTVINERFFRKKDGTGIYIETTTRRLTGSSYVSFMRDISERKSAETAIRENELRWKLALDKSELGVWEMNFEKNSAFISEKTREQTGYHNETDLANPDFWLQAIVEEDKPAVLEKFINTLKGTDASFDATFRVLCKGGEIKWFRFTGNVSGRDDDGRALRIIGVHEHLTDVISREKELQLKEAALESTISGIGMADMYGTITYVNAAIVKIWGATDKNQLIGKKLTDVFYGEGIYQTLESLRSTGSASGEDLAIRVDGTVFPIEFNANLIRDKNGEPVCLFGSFIDISHRRLAQQKLKESETLFREITQHSPSGVVLLDKQLKFAFASDSARRISGYQGDELIGADPVDFTHPDDLPLLMPRLMELMEVPGSVLTTEYRFLYKDGSWRYIQSTFSNLLHIAHVEAVTINFRDIHEERMAQLKLQENELQLSQYNERFQLFSKATNDGIWEWDIVSNNVWWNESFYLLMGFDPAGPMPSFDEWLLKLHPDDRSKVKNRLDLLESNNTDYWEGELRFQLPGGEWGTALDRAFVIRDRDGQPVRMIGALVDFTRQKQIEEKLVFEKTLSDSLIEKMPGIFYLYTREGRFIRWNKNLETISGYSAREIRKMHPFDFYDTDEKAKIKKRITQLFQEKVPGVELQLLTKQKKKVPVYINSMAIIYEGEPCVVGMATDISQLKKTQQELVESEEAFKRLFQESSEAILILDGKKFIDCNEATVSLLGYPSREEFLFQPPWKLSPLRQPDGELSSSKAKRAIGEALEKGYNRFEWIHRKADGTEFPVDVMLTPILVKGRQLFYTIWRDITDRKKAELALQQSIKEISDYKYAIDQSTIVSFSDPSGNITYVNDNFVKLYGYSKEEIIGVNHRILNSKIHGDVFWRNFWSHIHDGKVLRAEVCNKSKDGQLHWADTTIVPFLDEKGKPYQYLAIRTDITEKKRLEDELREQQRLEQIRITETAMDAQEKERNFLGQELHDNVNQILVGTKLLLSVVAEDPTRHKGVLDNSILNIDHAIQENRKLSHSLATPDLRLMSLPKQLSALTQEMFYKQPVKVRLQSKGFKDELLDNKRKIALYRIAQEQCTNILKYAQATEVQIKLTLKRQRAELRISDNGRGMDPGRSTDGIGIRNMKGRLSIYGGQLDIKTSPGEGFTLTVVMPL